MADTLALLFELNADGRPAVAEFKRVRAAFAVELEGLKKMAASAAKLSTQGGRKGSVVNPKDAADAKALKDRLEELRATFAALQKSVRGAKQELAGTDKETATNVRRFEVLEQTLAKLTQRADDLEGALTKAGATGQVARQIEALGTATERTNNTFLNTQARLKDVAAGSDALSVVVEEIRKLGEIIKDVKPGPLSQVVTALGHLGQAANGVQALKDLGLTMEHVARAAQTLRNGFSAATTGAQSFFVSVNQTGAKGVTAVTQSVSGLSSKLPQLAATLGLSGASLAAIGAAAAVVTAGFAVLVVGVLAVVAGFAALAAIMPVVIDLLQQIFDKGTAYNAQLEQTQLGIAAVITSLGELRDAAGIELKGPEKFNIALEFARDQLQKLKVDAINTTATFEQIAPAFQSAIGPGLRAGLDLDQIRQTVVRITQAAGAVGIPFQQLNQEVRAILDGTINEDARLAKILGISNKLVASWKEQGTLAEELNKRLDAFGIAGEKAANTLDGLRSNLQEALNVFTGEATSRAFEVLKEQFRRIIPQLFDFRAAGLDKSIKVIADIIDEIFVRVIRLAGDVLVDVVGIIKQVGAFLSQNRDLIDKIFDAVEDIARLVVQLAKDILNSVSSTGKWRLVLEITLGILNAIKIVILALEPGIRSATSAASALLAILLAAAPTLFLLARLAKVQPGQAEQQGQGVVRLNPDGSLKDPFTLKGPPSSPDGKKDKGADSRTRERIRLLELEAARTEAINRQNIEAERLRFELRDKSLKQATDDEIRLEQEILDKKKKIFAAELIEAQKLGKGRDLAIKEINLKSLQAEIEFHNKVNQLRVNQRKVEEQAAIQHRQKLLDIQDEGDQREIARLEELSRTGGITAFELETRRAEIEDDARRRRRADLETELEEAKENKEERERILDDLAQFDQEAAAATEESERRKRAALEETVEAYNNYARAIVDAQEAAAGLIREAARIEIESLRRRVGDRRRILREMFRLERQESEAHHRENLRRIDDEEQAAIRDAEKAGDIERRRLEIEREFNDLRLAEQERFEAERRANEEDQQRALDPLGPLKDRWEEFKEGVENANDSVADSVRSVAEQVSSSFGAMVDATRQAIQGWILYGDSIGKALKAALAQQFAAISAEATIQALKHAAYAIGSLAFGNFASAAKHAQAAAMFGALAAATGIAGRALAKSAGLYNPARTTASSAVNGGEPSPRNAAFNYGGQGPVESSARAAQEGSGGFLGRFSDEISAIRRDLAERDRLLIGAVERNTQTFSQFGVEGHGVVVKKGAGEASAEIAGAVVNYSNSSGDFNEKMQRNLGFA